MMKMKILFLKLNIVKIINISARIRETTTRPDLFSSSRLSERGRRRRRWNPGTFLLDWIGISTGRAREREREKLAAAQQRERETWNEIW